MTYGTGSRILVILSVLCSLVLVSARSHASPCPTACVALGTNGPTECGSATTADSLVWTLPELYRAAYTIASGWMVLYTKANGDPHQDASSSLELSDEFSISGSPPGAPVTFTARLSVSGVGLNAQLGPKQYAVGSTEIGIRDGSSGEVRHTFDTASETVVLDLPVTVLPGEPFTLTMFARGAVSSQYFEGATWAEGVLSFQGLPPDVMVQSCGGYVGNGFAVPVRHSSWGNLKLRYR